VLKVIELKIVHGVTDERLFALICLKVLPGAPTNIYRRRRKPVHLNADGEL
jgi:hypothetical protein